MFFVPFDHVQRTLTRVLSQDPHPPNDKTKLTPGSLPLFLTFGLVLTSPVFANAAPSPPQILIREIGEEGGGRKGHATGRRIKLISAGVTGLCRYPDVAR